MELSFRTASSLCVAYLESAGLLLVLSQSSGTTSLLGCLGVSRDFSQASCLAKEFRVEVFITHVGAQVAEGEGSCSMHSWLAQEWRDGCKPHSWLAQEWRDGCKPHSQLRRPLDLFALGCAGVLASREQQQHSPGKRSETK